MGEKCIPREAMTSPEEQAAKRLLVRGTLPSSTPQTEQSVTHTKVEQPKKPLDSGLHINEKGEIIRDQKQD